jgi:hypothetical protein
MKKWIVAILLIAGVLVVAFLASKGYREELGARNYMRSLVFCMCRMYPDDHDGYLPSNFLSLTNYSDTPKLLVCPGDHIHRPATSWASFTTNNSSFEIVSPGARANESNTVFLRCTIYGYVAYANGDIYDSSGHLLYSRGR